MRDWERLVRARLGPLRVARERRSEIVAEIAAHLEDATEEAVRAGAAEEHAVRHALALVPDWGQLTRELRKETDMNQRLRTLWVPGATMAALAMGALFVLSRAGLRPRILWLGGYHGHAVFFYLPWLLLLPVVGAIGAFWSRRAGGSRAVSLLAATLPSVALAAFFLALFPVGMAVDSHVPLEVRLAGFGAIFLAWVLAPAVPLLVGAAPFLLGPSPSDSPSPSDRSPASAA